MIHIDFTLRPTDLSDQLKSFWDLSGEKIMNIQKEYDPAKGSPVFTVDGKYTTRGWTEWTQGFQYGSAVLQYDATGENAFLEYGRKQTLQYMAPHLSHTGVHDHGFNNLSTYGNLLRLMAEGKTEYNEWEKHFYELALKVSGAVQASRWTSIREGGKGFIYSFNGPHSLFVDTIRSVRILMISYQLGHVLQTDNDIRINLLERGLRHAKSTADFSVYYGEGRDKYDIWGRTAHESIFNTNDGNYRCPNSQQGYTGRSTWTRGLAWAMCGFAEELEFLDTITDEELSVYGSKEEILAFMLKAARATCDFYIEHSPTDGIPYWDTGAPLLHKLGDYLDQPANPYNAYEPVDSTAAAIGAQGLLRLGRYLNQKGETSAGEKYWQAGLSTAKTLLSEPYISIDPSHQGILLHSIYHEPNGWDNVPKGRQIACGESSQWGDYHMRELALYLQKLADNDKYYTFFNCLHQP
jgi:unsaturated chondroitin disaccharide hydrolase